MVNWHPYYKFTLQCQFQTLTMSFFNMFWLLLALPLITVDGTRSIQEPYKGEIEACILNTLPDDYLRGADLYLYKYLGGVYQQWDASSKKDYISWPHDQGKLPMI